MLASYFRDRIFPNFRDKEVKETANRGVMRKTISIALLVIRNIISRTTIKVVSASTNSTLNEQISYVAVLLQSKVKAIETKATSISQVTSILA